MNGSSSAASPDLPTRTRHGGAFSKLLAIIIVAGLGALTWAIVANYQNTGKITIRPLDGQWWLAHETSAAGAAGPAGGADADDLATRAKNLAGQAEAALWGQDGLVARCETWWNTHVSTSSSPTATTTPLPPPAPTSAGGSPSDRARLTQNLKQAEQEFRAGLDAFRGAGPAPGATASQKDAALAPARAHLMRARTLIDGNLPAYEALPDHDPALAHDAHQVRDYSAQLLSAIGER